MILQAFAAETRPEYQWLLRYNVAPTQTVMTISLEDGKRVLAPRRWG